MTATEELRRLLDERGVEWRERVWGGKHSVTTFWRARGVRWHYRENRFGEVRLHADGLTPEQAIAATLSDKYAEAEEWLRKFQREHDELRTIGPDELWALAAALHDDIPFGYEASMRLADWLFHASPGPGTCTVDATVKWDWDKCGPYWEHELSCGHVVTTLEPEPPRFCPNCGARIEDA